MTELKLTDTLSLYIDNHDKKVRLIVGDGAQELACRKESVSVLKRFISSTPTELFKGRLRLHKYQDTISVILKGEQLGVLSIASFEKALTANL